MTTLTRTPCRTLAALGAGFALALGGLQIAGAAEAKAEPKEDWGKMRQEWIQRRIDSAANRLEIKASQQGAWQAYAKAVESMTERPGKPPARDADAATMAKQAADRAAEFAKKLKAVADATAKLQAVLTPEQRKTLDQIAHEAGERMAMMMHRPMGMHGGMHDGMMGDMHDGMGGKDHEHCMRPGHEDMPMMNRAPMEPPRDGAAPPPNR